MARANSTSGTQKTRTKEVIARDFNWGSIFTGTKEALQSAGLLPAKFKLERTYYLPLTWEDRPMAALRWDAKAQKSFGPDSYGLLDVYVEYDKTRELAVRDRLAPVLQAVDGLRTIVSRAHVSTKAALAAIHALDDVRDQLATVAPPKLSEVVPQEIAEASHG